MVSPAGAAIQHAPLSTHADPDSSLRTPQLDWPRMFPCGPFGTQRAVINHGTDMSSTTPPITDQTLSRQDLEALLAGRTAALTFERCDFDDADLSRLDLRDCIFLRCTAAGASFARAQLGDTR